MECKCISKLPSSVIWKNIILKIENVYNLFERNLTSVIYVAIAHDLMNHHTYNIMYAQYPSKANKEDLDRKI